MKQIRKWMPTIWVGLMVLLGIYSVYQQPIAFDELLARISPGVAVAALTLIVFGKMMTIGLVWFTLRSGAEDRGWRHAWRVYSIADIGKYLPGGIWGIASRLALYKQAGIQLTKGTRLLLAETALLIGFSLTIGVTALLLGSSIADTWRDVVIIGAMVAVLFAAVAAVLGPLPTSLKIAATAITSVAWIAFALSFAIIASKSPAELLDMGGRFNVGFAAGQLAVFAPSGIGVREFVVASIEGQDGKESGRLLVELVVAHRLIWLVADFVVLLPALMFKPERQTPGGYGS